MEEQSGNSFYDALESGWNWLTGGGGDSVVHPLYTNAEEAGGFLSSSYEKLEDIYESVEDSPLFGFGKNLLGEMAGGSSDAKSRFASSRSRDPMNRRDAGARNATIQRDIQKVDPQMLGYTAQVMSMAQGLDRSSVPSIADLYAKINSGKSRGPTITLESASDAIDLELTDKYSKG